MLKKLVKNSMPPIGETERTALNCGTVSLDGKIFAGTYSKDDVSYAVLSREERCFIENEVPTIINAHVENGFKDGLVHPKTLAVMGATGIFGLNIPKHHGGLDFSPAANSAIMTALSASGHPSLTVCAMVPNSLGPAELLMHHGTLVEQNKYLRQLADGRMIPCFALTGPLNGSDATSNMDKGVIDGNVVRTTLDKRYITLAPIADLIGIAVDVEGHGITLFLIERDHPGLEIGMRHDPLGLGFPNGPIRGVIELDLDKHVLGGRDNLGRGWQMLVECLSVGRAISLPAMGAGGSKMCMVGVAGHTSARSQFKLPLRKFEAVQEKMANILYHTLIVDKMQEAVNGELNNKEQPAILGAMLKYQATERARIVMNESMDILGGQAIQKGPMNWIEETYRAMPVGITVEGANAMTRSLITFGQGLVRAHPAMQDIMDGAHGESKQFYRGISTMAKHIARNKARAMTGDVTALFAFTADCCLTLGGKLKRSEYVSGRMADFFSNVFALPLVKDESDYVYSRLMYETKEIFEEIVSELPMVLRPSLRIAGWMCFRGCHKPRMVDVRKAMADFDVFAAEYSKVIPEGANKRLQQHKALITGGHPNIYDMIQVDDK